MAREPIVVQRPTVVAVDARMDALFAAKSALKRAIAVQQSSELQVDQLRALVDRLEAERRSGR